MIEKTPGWHRFMMPFKVNRKTQAAPQVIMYGIGTAWLDNMEIKRVEF